MAVRIDPKQTVSFEELLMSQVIQQEALTRLLVEKGIFTKTGVGSFVFWTFKVFLIYKFVPRLSGRI